MAHPASLKLSPNGLEACVEQLISEGLGGIEVYWSKHSKSEIAYYEGVATRFGLIVTAGSDFHGINKPTIELGAQLHGQADEAHVLDALETAKRLAGTRTMQSN